MIEKRIDNNDHRVKFLINFWGGFSKCQLNSCPIPKPQKWMRLRVQFFLDPIAVSYFDIGRYDKKFEKHQPFFSQAGIFFYKK